MYTIPKIYIMLNVEDEDVRYEGLVNSLEARNEEMYHREADHEHYESPYTRVKIGELK
jgi:hypothetical protein